MNKEQFEKEKLSQYIVGLGFIKLTRRGWPQIKGDKELVNVRTIKNVNKEFKIGNILISRVEFIDGTHQMYVESPNHINRIIEAAIKDAISNP